MLLFLFLQKLAVPVHERGLESHPSSEEGKNRSGRGEGKNRSGVAIVFIVGRVLAVSTFSGVEDGNQNSQDSQNCEDSSS